ncbi:MAG TPA: hypothetical protein VMH85_10700 [Terriglobales bacterium]|nr:hypothetical protein [Terriglobales bacterium]
MSSRLLVALAAVSMLFSLSAFARQSNKDEGKFTLANRAEVGSTQLAPGSYKAEWNGTGNDVKVNILKGKEVVATTQAQVQDHPNTEMNNSVTVNSQTNKVEEIDFGKQKEALVLK